jgi:L-aminopeptidase/D-esterase-like protein
VIVNGTLTDVPGVAAGHWTDTEAVTGVPVMTFPEPNVAAVEIRGAGPGTREIGLLAPGMKVETIQALVFSGGSAFGLAAADGVMHELEADGRGHPKPPWVVPIVPAAIIFDLMVGDGSVRPGPAEGAAAYRVASSDPVAMGSVGAGTGATISNWRGPDAAQKGGVGSAAKAVGDASVGALVVLNAGGDIFTLEGEPLSGGPHVPTMHGFPRRTLEQTTLVAIATDARLRRVDLQRLCIRAHDALAACIRPVHTRYDGDIVFAVSCGDRDGDLDELSEIAFEVVGRAIAVAVEAATSLAGVPTVDGNDR